MRTCVLGVTCSKDSRLKPLKEVLDEGRDARRRCPETARCETFARRVRASSCDSVFVAAASSGLSRMRVALLGLALALSSATTDLRITFTKVSSPKASAVGLSGLRLLDESGKELDVARIANPDGEWAGPEGPWKLLDDDSGTKWVDTAGFDDGTAHGHSALYVTLANDATFPASIEFVTANHAPKWDPVSWTVEYLDVCGTWRHVEEWDDVAAPLARQQEGLPRQRGVPPPAVLRLLSRRVVSARVLALTVWQCLRCASARALCCSSSQRLLRGVDAGPGRPPRGGVCVPLPATT